MIAALARLIRLRLCLLATAGAAAGYVLYRPRAERGLLILAGGAFLLAAGCSALNQAQERRQDAAMRRTADRPLPAGRLGMAQAQALALACLALALALLWAQGGAALAALGALAPLIYNGLYTPLKRVTPFALLVGGVAGALPPVIGWAAAGGPWLDFRVALVAVIFYFWQIPHFGLLARRHRADYQAAGFPLAGLARARTGARSPLMVWLAAYCALLLMAPAFCLVASAPAKLFLALLALTLGLGGGLALDRDGLGLRLVNASLVLFLLGLAADALGRAA